MMQVISGTCFEHGDWKGLRCPKCPELTAAYHCPKCDELSSRLAAERKDAERWQYLRLHHPVMPPEECDLWIDKEIETDKLFPVDAAIAESQGE